MIEFKNRRTDGKNTGKYGVNDTDFHSCFSENVINRLFPMSTDIFAVNFQNWSSP